MAVQFAARSLFIASVAVLGAGVIVVTPAAPALLNVEAHAVTLTAVDDPITAFEDVLQTASANATTLYDDFAAAPFPALQQFITNVLADAQNYPADAATLSTDIGDHVKDLIALLDPSEGGFLYSALPGLQDYQLLYSFAESPVSGVVLGEVATVLSPILALNDSYQDIVSDLGGAAPDTTAAFNDLLNIPANVADAYLNGQFLDGTMPEINLSSLVTALGPAATGYSITDPVLPLGGLLSPGGGSFLDALAYGGGYFPPCPPGGPCSGESLISLGGQVGPIGALEVLSHDVAQALGGNAPGNPFEAVPDLSTLFSGDLSTALANLPTEFSTLTTDLLTALTSSF
jgi:hypothetical protein